MSAFIREFEAILAEENIRSGSKVFEIAGLDKSMLSRIRAGARIQFDEIPRVAAAISSDAAAFLRLLRARMMEECVDPRAKRINVTVDDAPHYTFSEATTPYSTLPPKQASAIANIVANLPTDAGLRNTILWLGNEIFAAEVSAGVRPETTGKVVKVLKSYGKLNRPAK